VRRWNGTPWDEVGTGSASGGGISNTPFLSAYPSLAIAPDGTPYVAWEDDPPMAAALNIYIRRWDGSAWIEVGTGSASDLGISQDYWEYSEQPSVAVAPDGTPFVAWHTTRAAAPLDLEVYIRSWNGTAWVEVGAGSASGRGVSNTPYLSVSPSLAIAPDGTPYVAWYDSSGGNYEIYVKHWNGLTWQEMGAGSASGGGISDDGASSALPSTAVAPDGSLYVAWNDESSGNWEIYVRRHAGDPTTVTLAGFEAISEGDAIRLEWETASEVDNLGFDLYRSQSVAGEQVRLNAALIPGQNPGSPTGAVYTWLDESVTPGLTNHYWLEDVDVYGQTTQHGPVQVTLPSRPYCHYLPLIHRSP
jgi:hypothetical protein